MILWLKDAATQNMITEKTDTYEEDTGGTAHVKPPPKKPFKLAPADKQKLYTVNESSASEEQEGLSLLPDEQRR